ncbi:MAG: hypothetical protein O3C63_01705 [Cyanobacteria bacterium]|nr:hypothetical protein [Cyanobacteriota bacterium]
MSKGFHNPVQRVRIQEHAASAHFSPAMQLQESRRTRFEDNRRVASKLLAS